MPRKPRVHVAGGVYHVTLRGNHQEALFPANKDRSYLNALVGDVVARFGLRIFAYCWMTNHLHLAVQVGEVPLSRPMQRLAMRYALHVHRGAGQVGHLFERRYRAKLVDVNAYLKSLVRYIHLNPVSAGMVNEPLAYPWSSHGDYLGRPTVSWVDANFVLDTFGSTLAAARVSYARFMRSYADEDLTFFENADVSDAASAVRLRPSEPRLPDLAPRESLGEIAARLCERAGIAVEQLGTRSRQRRLSVLRAAIAREAVNAGVATLAEVGRLVGRSPSVLAQALACRGRDEEVAEVPDT